MEITATRRIQFCSGHRVYGHENKCAHLHGHNYVALLTARSVRIADLNRPLEFRPTDEIGRVIDFSVLKEKIGGWVDTHWDHAMVWYVDDEVVFRLYKPGGPCHAMKNYALEDNPTAENMARHLLEVSNDDLILDTPVELIAVTLWETENCYATVTV